VVPRLERALVRRALAAVGLEVRRKRAAAAPRPRPARPGSPHLLLASHVAGLLAAREVELVLDVGANVGAFGRLLRDAGYRGRIASFEPVAAPFEELSVAAANDPLWSVHRVALGRESGTRTINVMAKTAQSSFHEANSLGRALIPTLQTAYTEQVEVRRLDEIFAEVAAPASRPRTYLKMDTQGWDLEVLAGAGGCLDAIVALQSELAVRPLYDGMPTWLEALTELDRLGFTPTGLYPVGRDPEWRILEYDCVMARA
jgi:FkbM family methyltransferase